VNRDEIRLYQYPRVLIPNIPFDYFLLTLSLSAT
jgi:hypothetical protein